MTEEKETKKKAAPKAKAATGEKAPVKKAAAAPSKKAKAPKASGKTVVVTQTGSPVGRKKYQRATLIGLGLNKMNRRSELEDTPSVRGMIETVKHLVKVEEVA